MRRKQNRRIQASSTGNNSAPQKKRKNVNIRRLVTVCVVTLFSIYFVYVMIWQHITISKKNDEIEVLKESINNANQRTEKLQAELENLEDPEYLEKMARDRLGMVLPNERVFIDANKSESNN